ncbi:unnamed protein product [Rhizopus microsporus]
MVITPLQAVLKDDNESWKIKLDINQVIPKEAQREEINLILSIPKPALKKDFLLQKTRPVKKRREYEFLSHQHLSFVYSHFFGKRSRTPSSEESIWFGKVEPLDIVLTEYPPQMRSLIGPLLKTFATNIATMYSDERVSRLLEKTLLVLLRLHLAATREKNFLDKRRG